MAQRISRAKATIRASSERFALPGGDAYERRLRTVRHVLYLIPAIVLCSLAVAFSASAANSSKPYSVVICGDGQTGCTGGSPAVGGNRVQKCPSPEGPFPDTSAGSITARRCLAPNEVHRSCELARFEHWASWFRWLDEGWLYYDPTWRRIETCRLLERSPQTTLPPREATLPGRTRLQFRSLSTFRSPTFFPRFRLQDYSEYRGGYFRALKPSTPPDEAQIIFLSKSFRRSFSSAYARRFAFEQKPSRKPGTEPAHSRDCPEITAGAR